MPLGRNIKNNIRELSNANKRRDKKRPKKQVVAIAYAAARKKKNV